MKTLKRYVWNIFISLDQFANTVLGGDPDETISSRIGKLVVRYGRKYRLAYWLCRLLHAFDPKHCERAIEADEGKDQVVKR